MVTSHCWILHQMSTKTHQIPHGFSLMKGGGVIELDSIWKIRHHPWQLYTPTGLSEFPQFSVRFLLVALHLKWFKRTQLWYQVWFWVHFLSPSRRSPCKRHLQHFHQQLWLRHRDHHGKLFVFSYFPPEVSVCFIALACRSSYKRPCQLV